MSQQDDIAATLGLDAAGRRSRWRRWLVPTLLVVLVAAGVLALTRRARNGGAVRYTTAEVTHGSLLVTVTATGNLEPTNQVQVGSELSGIIESVAVDFNDRVTAGQTLATLDTDKLAAQVQLARAAVQAAQARVEEAQATLTEADKQLVRAQRLAAETWQSVQELDVAQAARDRAAAGLAVSRADVAQAKATLNTAETDLAKAVIRAPIDGIVLERSVEPGQTVAASLQAPVLFTLAEDLTRMELHVDIDEADVGRVAEGQDATFVVDAFPERTFHATVRQVRYAPQTTEGVVTYGGVLEVDNSDLSLRPGMTATADIMVENVTDALLVPNPALRFTPPTTTREPETNRTILSRLFPRHRRPTTRRTGSEAAEARGAARVWVLRDGRPASVDIRIGPSDGMMTVVRAGDLAAGTPVITDAIAPAAT